MALPSVKFDKETFEFSDQEIALFLNMLHEAPYKVAAPVIANIQGQLHGKFLPKPPAPPAEPPKT